MKNSEIPANNSRGNEADANFPFVSIVMTAYNRGQFISEAINSVLKSTYNNFELIIVDDNSVDSTVEIAKEFARQDARIKLYKNDNQLGQFGNRNKAISFASGEYLFTVDSDDTIYPDSISKAMMSMLSFPDCFFAMSCPNDNPEAYSLDSATAIKNHFFKKPFLFKGPGATVIRRDFMHSIGSYPLKYGPTGDLFFNLKATVSSPVLLLPYELVNYRRHEGQELNKSDEYLIHNYTYLNDAIAELDLPLTPQEKKWLIKKNKRRFAVNISRYFMRSFNFSKTWHALEAANFSFKDALQGIFH